MSQVTKEYKGGISPLRALFDEQMDLLLKKMHSIKNKSTDDGDVSEEPLPLPPLEEEIEQESIIIKTKNMSHGSQIKIQAIQDVKNTWEAEKKKDLVVLGNSHKAYPEILAYLENEIANSSKMVAFRYKVPCFKNDGVYQLHMAIEEHIGVAQSKADQKPSGGGDRPIDTLDVVLADGRRVKIPYGTISLPDMGDDAQIEIYYSDKDKFLSVKGTCQFKFQSLIDTIIDRTHELLNTNSIYKGQAIEINAGIDAGQPVIMNLSSIEQDIMILSDETEYALSPLTARIDFPEKCIANNIPIKFGILIEGPYGTGKTLYAFKLANKAIKNGWSFIYLKSPELLADTLRMAKTLDKNGHGIIVFVEDIDQVTRGDRNAAMQDILNTLDGGDTKDMNVISMFTTNHLELIEPTFLRGKRIGTIVSMSMLTAKTAKKYIDIFCEGVTLEGDFTPVYGLIEASAIAPAFMAEIIENVKSNMVIRGDHSIEADHFINCINSYLRQVKLSRTKDTSLTREAALVNLLRDNLMPEEFFDKLGAMTEKIVVDALENDN
jgi:hypothetical protein